MKRTTTKAAALPNAPYRNTNTKGPYRGTELSAPCMRPGSMDAMRLPSRMNNRLHYRDGRVEVIR